MNQPSQAAGAQTGTSDYERRENQQEGSGRETAPRAAGGDDEEE